MPTTVPWSRRHGAVIAVRGTEGVGISERHHRGRGVGYAAGGGRSSTLLNKIGSGLDMVGITSSRGVIDRQWPIAIERHGQNVCASGGRIGTTLVTKLKVKLAGASRYPTTVELLTIRLPMASLHTYNVASAGAQPIVPKVDAGHDRIGKRAQSRPDAAVGGQRCSRRPKT